MIPTALAPLALVLSIQLPDSVGCLPPLLPCPPLTAYFPVGERLVYDAKFGFIPVGTAELEVMGIDTLRGEETLHIQFRIRGGTFFYKINNVMDSWVGLYDFQSRRFVQDQHEGSWERRRAFNIFADSGFFRQEDFPDTTFETVAEPLDDASFFYFVRTVDLLLGERHEFQRYFRPDRNPVVIEIVGRDTIDVPAGRFPVITTRPIIKGGGILAEKAKANIWVSDDDRRVVVQIKSKFSFGTVTMRLKEVFRPEDDR
jgi:hypothetical protein